MSRLYRLRLAEGIIQRFVTIEDAEFIYALRNDDNLGKFLSPTKGNVKDQESWIHGYKKREENSEEFYFITESISGEKFGVNRIYNVSNDQFELGSWLFKKNCPPNVAILSDLAARDYGFDRLSFNQMVFEVRKQNKSVIRYHQLFKPEITHEDDLNLYFKLHKGNYQLSKSKILQLYGN